MKPASLTLDPANLPKPWTMRQYAFAMAYLANGGNATEAAKQARYSIKTAHVTGHDILKKPKFKHVQDFIGANAVEVMEKMQVSVNDTLEHQVAMAHSNIMDCLTIDALGRPHVDLRKAQASGATKAIKSIEITELPPMTIVANGESLQREVLKVKLTLHDKPKTNETLMKHLGLLAPEVGPASHGDTNIQNNYYMNMSPLEIMKRMALMMYRQQMPTPPQPSGGAPSGGNNSGMVAKSPTGSKDKG